MAEAAALEVAGLTAGYGGRPILDGVDIRVGAREIVTVIGHNGAGKSTLLKAVFNMLPESVGEILLAGKPIGGLQPHRILTAGLAYVPQNHSIFPKLTIAENLWMGGFRIADAALLKRRIGEVETLFPMLAERGDQLAGTLSGGEQRMLEIARALLMNPRVMMLDEPSIGLAPRMVETVFDTIRLLKEQGKSVLMVEQNVRRALQSSDRAYVMELGRIRLEDAAQNLIGDERVARLYMGRGAKA